MPRQIRAAVCRAFGAPLELETLTLRDPGPGEIEVQLEAVAEALFKIVVDLVEHRLQLRLPGQHFGVSRTHASSKRSTRPAVKGGRSSRLPTLSPASVVAASALPTSTLATDARSAMMTQR